MGRYVSARDIETFVRLRRDGLTHREIADETGWSEDRIAFYLRQAGVKDAPKYDRAKVLEAWRAARPSQNDEYKHLCLIHAANGYGFSWWPPSLMERVYLLEKAPPRSREFWRGEVRVA